MVRAVLWGEGTLRRRYRRGLAIGLELNAIPLHVVVEAILTLRMAHSGEDKKAGSEQLHTGSGPNITHSGGSHLPRWACWHIKAETRHQSELPRSCDLLAHYTLLGLNGVALATQRVRVLRQVKQNSLHRHRNSISDHSQDGY